MEEIVFYLIGLGSGLLVATFSYWLTLRLPPKQKLHECYGDLLPVMEEITLLQDKVESLRKIDVKTGKDFWVKYVIMSEHLMAIGDVDTIREVASLLPEDVSVLQDDKAASEYLTFARLIVQRALNIEIIRLAREMFRQSVALKLLSPSQTVEKQLDDIKKILLTRVFGVSAASVEDLSGFIDVTKIGSWIEAQQATYQMTFGPDLRKMLDGLSETMKNDLGRKL